MKARWGNRGKDSADFGESGTASGKKIIEISQATPVACAKIYRAIRPIFGPDHNEMDSIQGILSVIGGGLALNAANRGRIVGSIGFERIPLEGNTFLLRNLWFFIDWKYQKTRTSEKLINKILEFSRENGILAMFGELADYRADNRDAFLASVGMTRLDNDLVFDGRRIPSA